ncbi:MAG: transposase [Calditrichaeota bacterium]|nr:transposase [Calditrichota bacterium]
MFKLPADLIYLFASFSPLFSSRVWPYALRLLIGSLLAIGKRTVTSCLYVMGNGSEKHFQNYHRVLNRARWSPIAGSAILLNLLVSVFAPSGELIFGLDDTIERRRGEKIAAKGIYRDPVRSSHSHFVKASGLRWLCCMFLPEIKWAGSVWALPFLTVLCPSKRYYTQKGRAHHKLSDRARQMIRLVARWLPGRCLTFVADSGFAVLDLLAAVNMLPEVSMITRLRIDAQLYEVLPKGKSKEMGRPRLKGKRCPSLKEVLHDSGTCWNKLRIDSWYGQGPKEVEVCSKRAVWYNAGHKPVPIRWLLIKDPLGNFAPQALLSTNLKHTPMHILTTFIKRWRLEVTFEEARLHLGIETQRQWNDKAIARTTPVIMSLFSLVTLAAEKLIKTEKCKIRQAAWYPKTKVTFSDAIAMARRCLWKNIHFSMSPQNYEMVKIPRILLERLTETVCYAA